MKTHDFFEFLPLSGAKDVNIADLVKSFPNFHFSVSPHVPFLNLLFERDSYSSEYLLAKIGLDAAEDEPSKARDYT